jgi:NAD(P) transhydrogenase
VIERRHELGGVCINTGTVPSKTLREAVLDLSGRRQRRLYGEGFAPKQRPDVQALMRRTHQVMQAERDVIDAQLARNGVTVIHGTAWFVAPREIAVTDASGATQTLHTEHVVLATGTTPGLPEGIHVDHRVVLTSDDLLCMEHLPKDLVIVGGGIVGLEYGCMLAALGVRVTLVDQRTQLLEMVDRELVDAFCTQAREMGLTLRLGEQVANIVTGAHGHAVVTMRSGKRVVVETVMVSAGRRGATDALALENAGITVDERGRIPVDTHYRTVVPHVYAVGDVIGFPALAATSAEQGRLAACHMFGVDEPAMSNTLPFGI